MDMSMIDKFHVLDSQLPGLRYLFPSNSDTDGLSSIFQDRQTFLRSTARHVGSHSAWTDFNRPCSAKRRERLKWDWASGGCPLRVKAFLARIGQHWFHSMHQSKFPGPGVFRELNNRQYLSTSVGLLPQRVAASYLSSTLSCPWPWAIR